LHAENVGYFEEVTVMIGVKYGKSMLV